MIKFTI